LVDLALKLYDSFLKRGPEVENLLVLAGSTSNKDGNVVTVYLNSYGSSQQCKVVINKSITLLDFEREIEKGLQSRNPMVYMVVNQNDP
jgi:hypothetical protein